MANKKVTGVILLFLLQLTLFSQAIVVSQFPDFGEQGLLQGNTDVLNPADYSV